MGVRATSANTENTEQFFQPECKLSGGGGGRKSRLQNSRFFFSKSVKKSVKRAVRVIRARASHARRACDAREKNECRFHTMSSFRPGGSKVSSICQKSVHNSTLFVNLIRSAFLPSLALCFQPRSRPFV